MNCLLFRLRWSWSRFWTILILITYNSMVHCWSFGIFPTSWDPAPHGNTDPQRNLISALTQGFATPQKYSFNHETGISMGWQTQFVGAQFFRIFRIGSGSQESYLMWWSFLGYPSWKMLAPQKPWFGIVKSGFAIIWLWKNLVSLWFRFS